jgi:malonyl-CoA O-methyltransferase
MIEVEPREGYRRWAASYRGETAISRLEDDLVTRLTPDMAGMLLLDAGCGTGRRLPDCGARFAIGVDSSPEMLAAGRDGLPQWGFRTMAGDVLALPLPYGWFDVVWCRLVIGHIADCRAAYAELARVAAPGARVIVSDFHPAADAAGHRRSFRHEGVEIAIEHHVHTLPTHLAAAQAVGLETPDVHEAAIGPMVRDFYARAGRDAQYIEHLGLPVVLAIAFQRAA